MKYIFADTLDYIEEVKGYKLSQKQQAMLVDQRDFVYRKRSCDSRTGRTYWTCRNLRRNQCKASCVSFDEKIVFFGGDHNHAAPEPDD